MVDMPQFTWWGVLFSAIGVLVLWAKLGSEERKVYGLGEMLDTIGIKHHWRAVLEIVIFVIIGCIISIAIVKPTTAAQAFTSGLGWTGLCSAKKK